MPGRCLRLWWWHHHRSPRCCGPVFPAIWATLGYGSEDPRRQSGSCDVAGGDFFARGRTGGRMAGLEHNPRTGVGFLSDDLNGRFERDTGAH